MLDCVNLNCTDGNLDLSLFDGVAVFETPAIHIVPHIQDS